MSTSDELKSACEELGALIRPHIRPFVSAERVDMGTARQFTLDSTLFPHSGWLKDVAPGLAVAILQYPELTVSVPLDAPHVDNFFMYHDPESGLHIRGIAMWVHYLHRVVQRFDILLAKPV